MSAAMTESPADRARARIRHAFTIGRAIQATTLHVEPLPEDAPLADLLRAASRHGDWKARAGSMKTAMDDELDAAARLVGTLERDVAQMEAVADHLTSGEALPAGVDGATALAARLLAGTEAGLATARQMRQELAQAARQAADVKGELRKARSAAVVAQANATLTYLSAIGLGGPDAQRVRSAWSQAIASHRSLLAEMKQRRAGRRDQHDEGIAA